MKKIMLVERDADLARSWLLERDLPPSAVEHVSSIGECLARFEWGADYDLVVLCLPRSEEAHAEQAAEAIHKRSPATTVEIELRVGPPAEVVAEESDPFLSLAIKRPVGGIDPELETLIKQAYTRSKAALGHLERTLLPLVERVNYLEQELLESKQQFQESSRDVKTDASRSMGLSLSLQSELGAIVREQQDIRRALSRIERKTASLLEAQQNIEAVTNTFDLFTRFWRQILAVGAAMTAIALFLERVIQLFT